MRFLLRCTRPLALLLLAIILLPSLTAAAADYVYGQRSLAAGTTGSDVAELKKRLITTGYLAGSPSTTFDAATEKALTAFQGDFCLPATGRFSLSDLRTLERAFIEINAGRSLSPACKGVPPAPPAPPVPGTPSSGSPGTALTPYTVKAGDTLWGIANQYGTTVSAIQQTNGLSGSLIVPGQVLMIPVSGSGSLSPGSGQGTVLPPGSPDPSPGTPGGNGGATNGAASGGTGAYPTPTITRRHTVAAGENLDLIAARYGTTASVLAAFNSLSGPGLAPGQVLAIPRNAGAKFEVQGYFIGARIPESESYQALAANWDTIGTVIPVWFTVDGKGNLAGPVYPALQEFAKQRGQKVLPLFKNIDFSSTAAHQLLSDASARTAAVVKILRLLVTQGYDGAHLDFENIPADDRVFYSLFVKELGRWLKANGKLLTVAVPAKASDTTTGWGGAFDYAAIGREAHQIMIMAYDQHWRNSFPGPVGGSDWAERVVSYAASVVPPSRIILGVPGYGYDWPVGMREARSLGAARAAELAAAQQAAVRWDETSRSPYFFYTQNGTQRVVWFEDERSLESKIDLVRRKGLAGIALWRLGYEAKGFWEVLRKGLP